SVDATFNPGATGGNVLALGLSADGNRLYAGGAFSAIGGTAQRYLAALDAHSGAVDPGFDAAAANTVQAVSPSTATASSSRASWPTPVAAPRAARSTPSPSTGPAGSTSAARSSV